MRAAAVGTDATVALVLSWLTASWGDGFDWQRDLIVLQNGKQERGVVLQSFDPDHVLLLREGNRREEIPRADIRRVDMLRDRLAAFMNIRRPGLDLASEWDLVEDARAIGLARMARLQAYHVLLSDPEHSGAHEFLGHKPSHGGWKWAIDGKLAGRERFTAMSSDWNHRLVLESEHFVVETNCGLRRGLDVLFDLEGLYLWWLENLGPSLRLAEDVDDPEAERITFLVHQGREDPAFLQLNSDREPYYDPSGRSTTTKGGFNVARTYFVPDEDRPLRLFELGTEVLMYSTLVLGRSLDEADFKIRRLSHWAEIGLGYWIARHCAGAPGYPKFARPFERGFQLDPGTAGLSLEPIRGPHLLLKGQSELANLVALPFFELVGNETNVARSRARACSFISFLIEANLPLGSGEKSPGRSRDGLWHYLREVYGTQKAYSNSAFDAGLEGGKVEMFEAAWKAWTASFPH